MGAVNVIKMLIVDDFIETAETLSSLYTLRGDVGIVATATNTEQVWRILGEEQVDIVSLDIELGSENGLEVCRVLHEKYPDVFKVMCSVEATIDNIRMATEAGADHFLAKPVTVKEASETIQLYMDKKRGDKEAMSPLTDENLEQLFDAIQR